MQLKNFDIDVFLREYWQRKPLLIRNPWAAWSNPMSADELAGLALEEEIESRLVVRGENSWAAENGPLPEARFAELDGKAFTLLVQAVNHHVGEVAALIEPFRFIPDWRIDDVMVSYASEGGGVGPHYDQYDVFLVQGAGRRFWRIGQHCDENSALLPHDDLRLLADFDCAAEYILEPGDMLYVPPGIAHDGVAMDDDCMTYSIGFRAPSRRELIANWGDDDVSGMSEDDRYSDVGLSAQDNPGEISKAAMAKLHAMVDDNLAEPEEFARWFGEYNSEPKYPEMDWRPDEILDVADVAAITASGASITRNAASRFAYTEHDGLLMLFADGESFDCEGEAAEFAKQLCAATELALSEDELNSNAILELLMHLYNQGSIAFADGQDGS